MLLIYASGFGLVGVFFPPLFSLNEIIATSPSRGQSRARCPLNERGSSVCKHLCLCMNSSANSSTYAGRVTCVVPTGTISMDFPQNLFFHLTSGTRSKKIQVESQVGESGCFWALLYFQEIQQNNVQQKCSKIVVGPSNTCWWVWCCCCLFDFHHSISYLNSKVTCLTV